MTDQLTPHYHFHSHLPCKGTFGHPIFLAKARGVRATLPPLSTGYGLHDSINKKTSRRKRGRKPPTQLCRLCTLGTKLWHIVYNQIHFIINLLAILDVHLVARK